MVIGDRPGSRERAILIAGDKAGLRANANYRFFRSLERDWGSVSSGEAERLELFGGCFDPYSRETLLCLPHAMGWKVLDVGAGNGSLARWIAGEVARSGMVFATDLVIPPAAVSAPTNLRFVRHDIVKDPLPRSSFDCIHVRSVLQLLPMRFAVVGELVKALRPGGWIVIEEMNPLATSDSDGTGLPLLWRELAISARSVGVDLGWSSELEILLRRHQLLNVSVREHQSEFAGGTREARLQLLTLNAAKPFIIGDRCDAATFEEVMLRLEDPDFTAEMPKFVSAIGQRPA